MSLDPMFDADQSSPRAPAKRGLPALALAAIAMGLGGLGLTAATSDAQFARGLEEAIAGAPAIGTSTDNHSGTSAMARTAPVAGSEAFWLGAAVPQSTPIQPVTFHPRALAPGDRFQFGGGHGQRILEVTDVRQMPLEETGAADASKAAVPMLIVTLRDVATPHAAPVRMLLEADAPLAGLTPLMRVHPADL